MSYMELVRDSIKVELVNIGEGLSGDYDENDPSDRNMLRFYVSREAEDGTWEDLDDASYCTALPADLGDDQERLALAYIMDRIYEPALTGSGLRRVAAELSWIAPDWLTGAPEQAAS